MARRLGLVTLLAASLIVPSSGARAGGHCHVPLSDWQPRQILQRKLEEQGWTIVSIRVDDGCYKVRATNPSGERLEGKFNPATLEAVDGEADDDDES